MINNGIEDIQINESKNSKGKGKIVIVVLFLILLIALGSILLYLYFLGMQTTPKENFLKSLASIDTKNIFSNELYEELYKKIVSENSKIDTNIQFSTNVENEELINLDINKFDLNLKSENDVINNSSANNIQINYSGNEIVNFKLTTNEKKAAISVDDITDGYIGVNLDKLNEVYDTGIEYADLVETDDIELSKDELKNYCKEYFSEIFTNIPEENFTVEENIAIQKENETISVIGYNLSLSQEELTTNLINVLEKIKNDEELITKIVTNTKNEIIINSNEQVEEHDEIEEYDETEEYDDINEYENTENYDNVNLNEILKENFSNYIRVISGKKIETTIEDFQNNISLLIEKIKESEGNGLKITSYVSDEKTEKISIVLPDEGTVDIEFLLNNDNECKVEITFLGQKNINDIENEDEELSIYSADENQIEEKTDDKKEGFKLQLDIIKNDGSSTIKMTIGLIEDEEINKKINIELGTSKNSNEYTSNLIVTMSTEENESKISCDNTVSFENDDFDIEELTSENCVFIDTLGDEEKQTLYSSLFMKVMALIAKKQESLNLIDTNNHTSVVMPSFDNVSSNVTKEEAKEALINKVSSMMGDAIERNEEFTIQNLKDLKIEGYEVSSKVTEENAVIVVDIYTFNIDSNFTLTEVE